MEGLIVLATVVALVFVTFGVFAFSHTEKFDDLMKGQGNSPQADSAAASQSERSEGRCLLCQRPLPDRSAATSDEVVSRVEQRIVADRAAVEVFLQ